jgi:hypothetical protein
MVAKGISLNYKPTINTFQRQLDIPRNQEHKFAGNEERRCR